MRKPTQKELEHKQFREYLPYCIEILDYYYYIVNRDYIYINTGGLKYIDGFHGKRYYLFNDGTSPFH
jgi:hypothetical protein